MDKLKLLKMQEEQDCEEIDERELEEDKEPDFKKKYTEFYDDVKQPFKFIKEDW